mmetsp:Transcript_22596/g.40678  ORF Transcript_22596/g.40678 Transcript_22596/m.40678 type:complete len:95 (+) Transcript_22596:29-313(+)
MSKDLFKPLDQKVALLAQQPGVSGVLVVDEQGLAVANANFNFGAHAAGFVSSLVKTASLLNEEAEPPVVAVELERSFLLICKHDDVTLAVNKAK